MSRESSPEMSREVIHQIAINTGETKRLISADETIFNPNPAIENGVTSQLRTTYQGLVRIARGEFGPDYHGVTQDMARAEVPEFMADVSNTFFMRHAITEGRDLAASVKFCDDDRENLVRIFEAITSGRELS